VTFVSRLEMWTGMFNGHPIDYPQMDKVTTTYSSECVASRNELGSCKWIEDGEW
jgi:hypothetical protein